MNKRIKPRKSSKEPSKYTNNPKRIKCTAKKSNGKRCLKYATDENGLCCDHDGSEKVGGAEIGNKYALKHGIYERYYSAAELADADNINTGDVAPEIKLKNILINRRLKYINELSPDSDEFRHHMTEIQRDIASLGRLKQLKFEMEKSDDSEENIPLPIIL